MAKQSKKTGKKPAHKTKQKTDSAQRSGTPVLQPVPADAAAAEIVSGQPDAVAIAQPQEEAPVAEQSTAEVKDQVSAESDLPAPTGSADVPEQPAGVPDLPEPTASNGVAPAKPVKSHAKRRVVATVFVAVAVIALVAAAQWYRQKADNQDQLTAANKALVAEVSRRAVLPADESPAVSTVVDSSKTNQAFLRDARQGDKVLLYFQSGKAVLYRPSTQQIVNMGPVTQPAARVFLRDGAAGDIPASLKQKLASDTSLSLVSQDAAPKQTYDKTLVIDLNGNRPDLAQKVARLVGGTVNSLPEGESRPDADILIIRGADSK